MPAQRGPATSRRTAIAGAAAGVLVAACDAGDPGPEPDPGASSTTPADPDAVLVGRAAALAADRLAHARTLGDRYPTLAPQLRAFVGLHRAHARVLPPPEDEPTPQPVSGGARLEGGLFRVRETQAARQLARWAVAAESGALARLLASMSAGVAAHVAASDPGEATR